MSNDIITGRVSPEELELFSRRLCRLTGCDTLAEAVPVVEVWRQSHIELQAERAELLKLRDAAELSERRTILADLVDRGFVTQSQAARPGLQDMPIADLREMLADYRKSLPYARRS